MTRALSAFALVLALAAPAIARDDQPLRLLVQVDGIFASRPSPLQDPEDQPSGDPRLRLRRVRVGDEVSGHHVLLRLLFEGQPNTAAGEAYPGLSGGRLSIGGPVRATEAFVGWIPDRALYVLAGSLRVPFARSRQVDEADLRLPERPAFVDAFTPDFRTGLLAGGDLGEIFYQAAILSADRTIEGHLFDAGYLAAGRLVAEPIGPVGRVPWHRGQTDPWYGWFRFAAGLSVMYGTLAASHTLAIAPEFAAQWRRFVVSAEYFLSTRLVSGASFRTTGQQGAVVEPGLSCYHGGVTVFARADWEQSAGTNLWGGGAGLMLGGTALRFSIAFERRWSVSDATVLEPPPSSSYWVIERLTVVVR